MCLSVSAKSSTMAQPEQPRDIVIQLSPSITNHLVDEDLESIWPYLPSLPVHIWRIWIYEAEPINAITYVLWLDNVTDPLQLYQLNHPLTMETMQEHYNYHLHDSPIAAPGWLLRDYRRHMQYIW